MDSVGQSFLAGQNNLGSKAYICESGTKIADPDQVLHDHLLNWWLVDSGIQMAVVSGSIFVARLICANNETKNDVQQLVIYRCSQYIGCRLVSQTLHICQAFFASGDQQTSEFSKIYNGECFYRDFAFCIKRGWSRPILRTISPLTIHTTHRHSSVSHAEYNSTTHTLYNYIIHQPLPRQLPIWPKQCPDFSSPQGCSHASQLHDW